MSEEDTNFLFFNEIYFCDSSEIDTIKQHLNKPSDFFEDAKVSNKNIYNLKLPNLESGAYVLEEKGSLFIPITFDVDLPHLKYINKMMHLYKDGTLTRKRSGNNIKITSGEMAIIFPNKMNKEPDNYIIRYETPAIECRVFKYTDKSYDNNFKIFKKIRDENNALDKKMDSVHKLDISDKEKEKVSNEILGRIEDLHQYEGEVTYSPEDPNICFLEVELKRI